MALIDHVRATCTALAGLGWRKLMLTVTHGGLDITLQSRPGSADEAEHRLRRALDLAGAQGARSLQLRAAVTLVRLSRLHGHDSQADELLRRLYGSFTEGRQETDQAAAGALLESVFD